MSSTSSAELAASASGLNEPGCAPSRSARSIPIASECSPSIGLGSTSFPMSPNLEPLASERLTLSAADSPARTFPPADLASVSSAENQGFGQNTLGSFAAFDLATSSWRTSQTCFIEGLEQFSETWPRAGMTRNGAAFRLPSSGFPKRATECGLLPTLVAADSRQVTNGSRPYRNISDGLTMTDWVRLNLQRKRVPLELGEAMMGYPDGWTESTLPQRAHANV